MNIKEFLESNGYKMWKEENESTHHAMYFQKRADELYPDSPLCWCNDKLFINIDVWTIKLVGVNTSCSIGVVGERPTANDGEWCDIKIYSLKEDEVIGNLERYEDKMIRLWETFYD
jgi:hypothetical protein